MSNIRWDHYPSVAVHPSVSKWLVLQKNLGLASNTIKAYARALEDYPVFSMRQHVEIEKLAHEPLPTQTATETQALVMTLSHGDHANRIYPAAQRPLPTQTIRDDLALVTPPFLIDHVAEYRPRAITQPMSTIVGGGNHQSVVIPPA